MDKKSQSLLIIFYRNPQLGKVKTRLAATLGPGKTLEVFKALAAHTRTIAEMLTCDKTVYYSEAIENSDLWPGENFMKRLQQGEDLGKRMQNAFREAFKEKYNSVCIIGTDCAELTFEIITKAFQALDTADAVIGPARDGGYYLLGMKQMLPAVFENKRWSTESVLADTLHDFQLAGLKAVSLPVLRDVDREEDLPLHLR